MILFNQLLLDHDISYIHTGYDEDEQICQPSSASEDHDGVRTPVRNYGYEGMYAGAVVVPYCLPLYCSH